MVAEPTGRAALEPAWATLNDLRDAGDRFERFVDRQLDRLEQLRLEREARERSLADRQQQVERNRDEAERQWQRVEAFRRTCEQNVELIQSEARRLAQLQDALAAQNDPANAPPEGDVPSSGLQPAAWPAERQRLLAALATARRQNSELVGAALELATVRRELAAARIELLRQRHRLAQAKGHFQPSMRRQLDDLQIERSRLTEELRHRHEQLAELRTCQQNNWADELARLRSLLVRRIATDDQRGTVWATAEPALDQRHATLHSVLAELDAIHDQLRASTAQPTTAELGNGDDP
ncbi:MAG TPA: hypothetical protein VG713_02000 [Pirellulales bacterium]|nr:hypothetical protein [Pirellulales bacterium]